MTWSILGALRRSPSSSESQEPIRSELFSIERLEQHAETLAAAQRVTTHPRAGRSLAVRLRENARILLEAYRAIAEAIDDERAITSAAEWLVDNFHIAEEQIREIRDDLPRAFYRQLPKNADGPLEGYPRVYGLAWAFVAHTDSRFDPPALVRFVRAYQRVEPMTIGELWAVAITLRIVLVENLRRAAELIVSDRVARQEADAVADRLLDVEQRAAEPWATVLRPFERQPLKTAFAVQLVQRLRDQDPTVAPVLRWLDERLAAQGTTADAIVQAEHQRQGAMNVTVRNVITSMRLMSSVDWAEFVESVSLVDELLAAKSDFAAMTFATRDRYRHAIEDLGRGAHLSELEVTRRALVAAARHSDTPRAADPGYHLLAGGRRAFEIELGYRIPVRDWLSRSTIGAGIAGYLAALTLATAAIVGLALLAQARMAGELPPLWMLAVLTALVAVPASDAAMALVNDWVTHRIGPHAMPTLALQEGVPPAMRTMVVVPTLLTNRADIDEQVERLEVHYLATLDGDMRFALLSDWADAPTEQMDGDSELLAGAVAAIARLNARHGEATDGPRFLLLHRRRVWNEPEGKWIGWERKRGKLHELNRLLRGETDTTFIPAGAAAVAVPPGVQYVITLDADTRLPRGAARALVGRLAHPLNRPSVDDRTGRVVDGHAILAPRVTPSLPIGSEGSLFQRLFSGPRGIDPYAFPVSDVYQDLCDEGSYSGKGIYHVDAFEAALAERVPENALLSHDLFEGIFARAGMVSDIEVVEDFPSRYDVASARQHRWVRGDWQLLPWILGHGRSATLARSRRGIPLLGRWKMFDNLRRSLSAPATLMTLLAAWLLPTSSALIWTVVLVAIVALPALLPLLGGILPQRTGISKRSHVLTLTGDLALAAAQTTFRFALLPHQAWLSIDAIVRTLFRLYISRRHMLEWLTAAQSRRGLRPDAIGFYQRLAGGLVLGVGGTALVVAVHGAQPVAAPFLLLWLLGPALAWRASQPARITGPTPVTGDDKRNLRPIARRTWRFFETFVTADENMLPPDNFQEIPQRVVAHRTSPTNIGLYLLSTVAAHDLGWHGLLDTVERIDATLATMQGLERLRGHFLNWYDTRDLRALEPKYVSSVDSGNLAGHLIALDNACRELADLPAVGPAWLEGLGDALALTRESMQALADGRRTQTVSSRDLETALDALGAALEPAPTSPSTLAVRLAELVPFVETVTDIAHTLAAERGDDASAEVRHWADAIAASLRSHARDLDQLMPWARLLAPEREAASALPEEDPLTLLLGTVPTLAQLPDYCEAAIVIVQGRHTGAPDAAADALIAALERSAAAAGALERRLVAAGAQAHELFAAMDFNFLFDPSRQLLSIGYRLADSTLDPNAYDLLASEARLASFVAIAKGDIPVRHWFRLGRSLTPVARGSALISWSGSMFEYLMPSLVMRAPAGSLLEQTSRFVVQRQIQFGLERGIPWGVSESAYNARDLELTYQYSNFGVPGLGLKRGLSQDAVVAPYATALAAMVDAGAAVDNFTRLAAEAGRGRYGWYEALDYTLTRVPEGESVAIVRAYMAHHQGMSIVAIANVVQDGRMRARFHADPIVQASELLLQERTPRDVAVARPRAEEVRAAPHVRELVPPMQRRFHSPHDLVPRTHLLSNSRYAVMLTGAGSGYSRWRDLAVTRWREDATLDGWGSYVYLRDAQSGVVWSAGYQPTCVEPDSYEVAFAEDRAEIARRDGTISTTLEVCVSPEDDAEVRRVSITNLGTRVREIELTSYAEVVLTTAAADTAHPAFAKLFVRTEFVEDVGALLATRRPRAAGEAAVCAAHLAVVEGETVGGLQYETDRARFLGRGRSVHWPIAVFDERPLSNTVGTVLDPIFSLRHRVRLQPGATARVAYWTLAAPTREAALDLADKHHDPTAFERATTLAWTQAQVQLHHLGIGPDEAHLFQRLANHVLYSDPALRPPSEVLARNELGPSTLWAQSISGDLPIVLARIDEAEDLDIVRQLLRAHEYWQLKQLAVDLVILNERPPSYNSELQAWLDAVLRANQSRPSGGEGARGSIFVLRAELISVEFRNLLQSVARAVLVSRRGSLAEQVRRLRDVAPDQIPSRWSPALRMSSDLAPARPPLEFFNGLGGFADGGREYVTFLGEGQWTPAPWINVIANASFGFQVSVEGGGYTWSANSRENQLSPWSNDPVGDRPGDTFYVRDEDSGALWGPTVLPIRNEGPTYIARHGQGYSRFEHIAHAIRLELLQYVPLDDPIKVSRLTIENRSGRTRHLSVTAYVEWVLAATRASAVPFIVSERDTQTGALFARNPWRSEGGDRIAFADFGGRQSSWTTDRGEFLGRNGGLDRPAALAETAPLSNRVGAGVDPCAALQTRIELKPNARIEVVFFLGETASRAEARALVTKYRGADLDAVLRRVTTFWDDVVGAVQVRTPDRSLDILLNRWLVYQTLVCRVWARSAFYQASGAYGFRDQLQDVMALAVTQPLITREHLLRAAGRQFVAGDVQHWWLPSHGQGVRTRVSDDRAWLAYAVAHYVERSGDRAVLDEILPFLEGPTLAVGEHDSFFQPMPSDERATLFEHCARALENSLATGPHGLPLMGTGDWNDGMNRVGEGGKGESVWLGWFLHTALTHFAAIAVERGESARAATWREHAVALAAALEQAGWDGDWYRRGYFDDGTPLGSTTSDECRIDSIAQSWAVLSGAADPARAARAMAAAEEYLVHRGDGLVLLFTPPFDRTPHDPGYIKGYPPGIRENGGQYTHAAIWTVLAFAALGDGDRAGELFSILNPINHSSTRSAAYRYKVEPYVACADIYAESPHVGRGGWTWYTGSASWMYRAGLEGILGFRVQGATLLIDPCVPHAWRGFEINFRYHSALYAITVENPHGVCRGVSLLELDGVELPADGKIPLSPDDASHRIRVVLG